MDSSSLQAGHTELLPISFGYDYGWPMSVQGMGNSSSVLHMIRGIRPTSMWW